jgi:hypothetical protein
LYDEFTLQQKGEMGDFANFFENFSLDELRKSRDLGFQTIALKHPLQSFILPYIDRAIHPKYVFVTRPLDAIETSRQRRRWHSVYGMQGARQIYSTATDFFIDNSVPYLSVPYGAILHDEGLRRTLLNFCNLQPTSEMLQAGVSFLKS